MELESIRGHLAKANRILDNEGIVDEFGHVTARHPTGDRMLVSTYQSPALVEEDDIIEVTLDGDILADDVDSVYGEIVIHSAIYEARDDVNAVVHTHAAPVIPFTVSDVEIEPVTQVGAAFQDGVPVFEEYDENELGQLITNEEESKRMARNLGEHQAQLLYAHGANVVGSGVREATILASNFVKNAGHQLQAEQLSDPSYSSNMMRSPTGDGPMKKQTIDRVWDYLTHRLNEVDGSR